MEEYLAIARVVAPHGVRGEVRCQIITDFPERFAHTRQVAIGPSHTTYRVVRSRFHRGQVILKLEGVDTVEAAERLRGQLVEVPLSEAVALPHGHYFWHQILGLVVETVQGERLGRIVDILETGSNDVYVVRRPDGGELLLPAIRQVVRRIDLERGVVVIELLPTI